jgi:hypothetical protein
MTNFISINVINKTTGEYEFSWDPVVNPAASDYFLQIRVQNDATFVSYYSNTNTKTVSNLVPGQLYELRLVVRYSEISWGVTGWRTFNSNKEMDMPVIQQNMISVYPNPVNNLLNIQTSLGENENLFWALYDLNGKCVISGIENIQNGNNNIKVDLSQYANGMYILQSVINDTTSITRIIKE